jgi:hypothetical protein
MIPDPDPGRDLGECLSLSLELAAAELSNLRWNEIGGSQPGVDPAAVRGLRRRIRVLLL